MSSIQDLKKNLDAKMKGLRTLKFGFTGIIDDNIEIDARGVAYKKEVDKKIVPGKTKDKIPNKDDNIKDDELTNSPPNVHVGEESTGFGGSSDKEQFLLACMQAGGSLENCLKTWDNKKTGVGMTPEKVKLIIEHGKTKSVDILEYRDGDLMRIKNDFGVDLKPIIEKLNRIDGICANNKKLTAENKKIKDDLVAMKGIFDNLNVSWLKKAENRKLELIELLSKEHKVSDDFLKEKNLDELENYLKLLEIAKKNQKDDGIVEDFDPYSKENLSDGIQMPFGKPISHKEYLNEQTKTLRKSKFGWVK